MSRRRLMLGVGALGLAGVACAEGASLPAATSLPQHLVNALRQGDPLLVMVSLPGCPFCRVARDNYLAPLQREQNLPIVQIDMLARQALVDFRDMGSTHDAQIRAWGVKVAPTVLFFGRGGIEAAPRLIGGMLPDFYGAYLEQRIATARKTLA
jgi:hypothetical protein